MLYVTRISHQMQRHKFNISCPDTLFMEMAAVPPEHEKWCIEVLRPTGVGMHYVTRR
jgi:hypothetical protein